MPKLAELLRKSNPVQFLGDAALSVAVEEYPGVFRPNGEHVKKADRKQAAPPPEPR